VTRQDSSRNHGVSRTTQRGLAFVFASILFLSATPASAVVSPSGRLPLRAYTMLDGLADDGVLDIFQDSRGFLWVGTNSGVSRFDGSHFVNDLAGHGSAHRIAEARDHAIWVATDDGLYRLDPKAPAGPGAFSRIVEGAFGAVHADDAGDVWAAAGKFLFRLKHGPSGFAVSKEEIATPFAYSAVPDVRKIVSDARGRLWIATHAGLACRLPDGRQVHYEGVLGGAERAFDLTLDTKGRIWVASAKLIVVVPFDVPPPFPAGSRVAIVRGVFARAMASTPPPGPDGRVELPEKPGEVRVFGPEHGLTGGPTFGGVAADRSGRVWVASSDGLDVVDDGRIIGYGRGQGVPHWLTCVFPDARGDVWFGTGIVGLRRWTRRGFAALGEEDGLAAGWVASIFETRDGRIAAATRPALRIHLLEPVVRRTSAWLTSAVTDESWGWGQIVAEDRRGRLWLGASDGLVRLPAGSLDATHPVVGTMVRALPSQPMDYVFRVFIDSRDELWASTFPVKTPNTLVRIRLSDGATRAYSRTEGTPDTATAVAESPDGSLWFGMYYGGLAREENGRFRVYGPSEGLPRALVPALWFESRDRLWAATEGGGLLRVDIRGERIQVRRYAIEDGLTSNDVTALVGDGHGALWVGTVRGVDRFEPATGRVESFSTADGLPAGYVLQLLIDRRGRLWAATRGGVGRFEEGETETSPRQAEVLVTNVEIDGERIPVPALGGREVGPIAVPGARSRLRIEYGAVFPDRRRAPAFRHRVVGLNEAWSAPTDRGDIDLAGLPPGRYRFEVRLAGDATATAAPAVVLLRVPAPIWRRPWFLALGAAVVGAVAWAVHRARVRRLLALERQRTRLAMDLHDEIGSSLGSIGLMADLAGAGDVDESRRREITSRIGDAASELGASLAELVGTLRPGGASLEALAKQLAERGRRLFPGGGAAFTTAFPDTWPPRPLDLAPRRDVFLIGAEALHNAARHAGAATVRLGLEPHGRRWLLSVEDDGRGIDPAAGEGNGLGLESMRRRADAIAAELRIEAVPGGGTRVTLAFDPWRNRRAGR
jgi:signal transduction histidine kinase/ligand-binding sensor domain-containing protein